MSANYSTVVRAAVYYRMSTDRQEDSIDRQRSQVEPYAARQGYEVARSYEDPGIAGDELRKRKAFCRMLEDAQRGLFDIILCDDKDRFGRFDSIDEGEIVAPLRRAGVRLETVAQGRIDWTSFVGRISGAALAEAKKIESMANSRRVITWMAEMARKGKWLGGRPPYGYELLHEEVETPGKGKRRRAVKLIPGDPAKVQAVQLMFRLYGERGFTLDAVAAELHQRGIPNPKGGATWNKTTVREALRNRKYVGDMTWNAGHDGKYSAVLAGGLVQTSDAKIPKRANPRDAWLVVPDAHEPLIDRELFELARARLAENKSKTTPLPRGVTSC